MLSRHPRSRQHSLQLRNVKPEDGHAKRKDDRGEQQQILSLFVEGRWMLEDAQAAGAEGHEAEPLPVKVSISSDTRLISAWSRRTWPLDWQSISKKPLQVLRCNSLQWRCQALCRTWTRGHWMECQISGGTSKTSRTMRKTREPRWIHKIAGSRANRPSDPF